MSEADELFDPDGDLPRDPESVPAADAFALVGDDTRIAILEALWRLPTPARFSDIREAVGMRDSAQFNYHLGKLTDRFIRKTEEGYELRTSGQRVVQAILAGSFTRHPAREIDIEDSCVRCGEELSATYEDEMLQIVCPQCGHGHGEYFFPPGGLHDRTDQEILAAFDQRVRHLHCLAKDGVCPLCNGSTVTTIRRGEDCCLGAALHAVHTCQQCATGLCSAVGLGLLDQPPVVSFYAEHGISLADVPYWQLTWCVDDEPVTVLQEDPWKLRVDMAINQDTLRVFANEHLDITAVEREM